ncbi:MAG: hypothetical protein ACXWP4_02585 [Polyangiales bacterium]
MLRSCALVCVVAASSLASAAPTAAETEAFAKGRQKYDDGKHAEAAQYFAIAIDGAAPTIKDSGLVNRGRMIWGASAMYIGKIAEAREQFERILRNDPKFEPDPILFPEGVLAEFRRIREKLEKEAADKAKGDEKTKRIAALEGEVARLTKRVVQLEAWGRQESVVTRRSRVIASLPFGIGQFQNGETALGVFFAATEVLTLGAATVSFAYHGALPRDPVDANEARNAASAARVINWISLGAFVALAVGGIVQAHVALVPESRETRPRPLPKGLAWQPLAAPVDHGAVLGLSALF